MVQVLQNWVVLSLNTHMMFSTDLGLMKMAMGWSWASCSLLMAFPDTSRIQCLPWAAQRWHHHCYTDKLLWSIQIKSFLVKNTSWELNTAHLNIKQFYYGNIWVRTFSATSRTDWTLVPYRWLLYCPASMKRWSWMSFSICSLDTTKW